jgi:hypothetical protein
MLGVTNDHPLLVDITYVVNLLLEGHTLTPVRGTLFGATLLAIAKKAGGIRPIAVGYVWRRLAAMVACNYIKVASAALLASRQLGFSKTRGAEAADRAARRHVNNMQQIELFLKTDFRNAVNTWLCRDPILEATARYFSELLQFTLSTSGHTSHLQLGDYLLQSAERAQWGDPL